MKQIKKLVSVMLSLAMVFAMSATAFATTETNEAASDSTPASVKHTYEIYQIFIGDYHEGVLSNIKWGGNSQYRTGEPVADDVLNELEGVKNATSDTEKLAIIN